MRLQIFFTSLFMHKVIVMQLKACKWDFTPSSNMSSKFNFVHVIFAYLIFVHLGAIIRVYLYIKNIESFRNGTINIAKDKDYYYLWTIHSSWTCKMLLIVWSNFCQENPKILVCFDCEKNCVNVLDHFRFLDKKSAKYQWASSELFSILTQGNWTLVCT